SELATRQGLGRVPRTAGRIHRNSAPELRGRPPAQLPGGPGHRGRVAHELEVRGAAQGVPRTSPQALPDRGAPRAADARPARRPDPARVSGARSIRAARPQCRCCVGGGFQGSGAANARTGAPGQSGPAPGTESGLNWTLSLLKFCPSPNDQCVPRVSPLAAQKYTVAVSPTS